MPTQGREQHICRVGCVELKAKEDTHLRLDKKGEEIIVQ